jgi:hypothetical protein
MMSNMQEELTPILKAMVVLTPTTFMFRGEPVQVRSGADPTTHPLPEMPLVRDIQTLLYQQCYIRRFEERPEAVPFVSDPSYVQRLAQSNRSQPRWEGGWSVYAVGANGQVSVQKGDRQRTAVAGEYVTSGVPGMPPQPGSVVSVLAPRESFTAQPGFYFMYGETLSDVWDEHALVRFYFHAPSDVAPALLDYLTGTLNRYQVPFRMKALTEPAAYQRSDAVVLYVSRRHYEITGRLVLDIPSDVAEQLRKSTPFFSRRFQDGVGLAEDPNTGESFGMHRCRMVAEGVVDAWMRSDQSVEGRLAAITARFAANSCNLDLPHLSPGSVDLQEISKSVEFAYA